MTTDLRAELYYSNGWQDISPYVYQRDGLTITRGRSDEEGQASASRCALTLDNRDGRFSPRNATGALYGLIGRNTPLRVSVPNGSSFLPLDGTDADYIDTPDSAALSITGDLDVRADLTLDSWVDAGKITSLAGKWVTTGNQRSWWIYVLNGFLVLQWSANGTAVLATASTLPVPLPATGRRSVRATIDVNNGAAGNTVTFYTSTTPGVAGAWTQLGAPVVTAGTTSIFDSTAPVTFGWAAGLTAFTPGRLHAGQLRNGIAGTVVANPDLAAVAAGAATFNDSVPVTWTVRGNRPITDRDVRFVGEIPAWPPRWDPTGRDVYVIIEAAGILRRLGQGATPLRSVLRRGVAGLGAAVVAFWPFEVGADATLLAPVISTRDALVSGQLGPDVYDGLAASAPMVTLGSGKLTATPRPAVPTTSTTQIRWIGQIPYGSTPDSSTIMSARMTGGTLSRVDVRYLQDASQGSTFEILTRDSTGTSAAAYFSFVGPVHDIPAWFSLEMVQVGADMQLTVRVLKLQAGVVSEIADTAGGFAGVTIGRLVSVEFNRAAAALGAVAVGHLTISTASGAFTAAEQALFLAYAGESAGRRVKRLCAENAVPLRLLGDPDATVRMGPQRSDTLLDLVRQCEDVDGGMLFEPRDQLGLSYRTRASLSALPATLALDYAADHLSEIEPTDDDQGTRNDVTATRTDGGAARVEETAGPLSVLDPPAGVGRYDEQITLNAYLDADLPGQAGWRVHLGTVDEQRFPRLAVHLGRAPFVASPALAASARALDVGDRLTVTTPPAWLPQRRIEQLAVGFAESITPFEHRIGVNCRPARAFDVGQFNDSPSRYSNGTSTLSASATSGATTVSVAFAGPATWSVADGSFGILVAGEELTVTAISGTTSPQTFTVTRAVNGVVKAHSSGEVVELARPIYYGL